MSDDITTRLTSREGRGEERRFGVKPIQPTECVCLVENEKSFNNGVRDVKQEYT